MARRIDVELTSTIDDDTWTWRAAGAREPKGTLSSELLYEGARVGDVVKAEADYDIDGVVIVSITPPKQKQRKEPETIELLGPRRDDPLVTTQLARKGRGGGGGGRRCRDDDGDGRRRRSGGPRSRDERPAPPSRPKPKRLRPGRTHRRALIDELPAEQQPVAEQLMRGGMPAVRQAIEKQNEQARAENRPEVNSQALLDIAESLVPKMTAADWRDRADAAMADIEELDLRDLRSVVVAADGGARGEEARELATTLREALSRRVEEEHGRWLSDMNELLTAGRTVAALRRSSRPPKAGAPLPPDTARILIDQACASLTDEVTQERWAIVLDALAYSPVRSSVMPLSMPAEPGEELLGAVRKLSSRIPDIAKLFGIEPAPAGQGRRRGGRNRRSEGGGKGRPSGGGRGGQGGADGSSDAGSGSGPAPAAEAPATDAPSGAGDTSAPTAAPAEAPAETAQAAPTEVAADAPAEAAAPEAAAPEATAPEANGNATTEPEAPSAESGDATAADTPTDDEQTTAGSSAGSD
ncbi:MAG: hypothetical protein S0880_12455 [Actinomycetota bacterium]|nr:hypothetical protein [Actinomycetota bacterium]